LDIFNLNDTAAAACYIALPFAQNACFAAAPQLPRCKTKRLPFWQNTRSMAGYNGGALPLRR
jgi:hypothetical protein